MQSFRRGKGVDESERGSGSSGFDARGPIRRIYERGHFSVRVRETPSGFTIPGIKGWPALATSFLALSLLGLPPNAVRSVSFNFPYSSLTLLMRQRLFLVFSAEMVDLGSSTEVSKAKSEYQD